MGFTVLLVSIAIIVIPLIYRSKQGGRGKMLFRTRKRIKWFFGGYLAVLLLSVVLYVFIPTENVQSTEKVDVDEEEIERQEQKYYEDLHSGRTEEIDPAFIEKTFETKYRDERLHIAVDRNQALDA